MTVFTLNGTVLLMCMWAGQTMRYSKLIKECVEVAVFAPPIGLNMNDFMLEKAFDMLLKLNKYIKHIRLTLNEIKPSKSTICINETHIIVVTTNRGLGRAPYI
jgi:hypothetical protein